MAALKKPSEMAPIKCAQCGTTGQEKGALGMVVCSCCLGVGYLTSDGDPLDDNAAIRLLKREANHWRKQADRSERLLAHNQQTLEKINRLLNPLPEIYKSDGRGQVYHGD